MALRKATMTTKPAKKSIAKDSNKVVKRSARGYHKYNNGLLNVTPKGSEKDVVKNNQNSPLLRLPPEIRYCIWEYSLGYNVIRVRVQFEDGTRMPPRLVLAPGEPGIGVALLRTCRQIYSETALMPLQLNTLAFNNIRDTRGAIKLLKLYQRKEITTIRLEADGPDAWPVFFGGRPPWANYLLEDTFPALQHIEACIFGVSNPENNTTLEEAEAKIRQYHRSVFADASVTMTVKGLDHPMPIHTILITCHTAGQAANEPQFCGRDCGYVQAKGLFAQYPYSSIDRKENDNVVWTSSANATL